MLTAGLCGVVCAQGPVRLMDAPTANISEYGDYALSFRFYSNGGVLSRLSFGVLNRVNVGFSWDIEELVGSDDVDLNKPTLNLKVRFWDGDFIFPALAFGYDGQGYFFDEDLDNYLQREKGVYLVATQEVLLPLLEVTYGVNVYDFSEDTVYGFAGIGYTLHPVVIIGELDNIHRAEFNRINGAVRFLITSSVSVDLAGRDIAAKNRDAERIIRINYRGAF